MSACIVDSPWGIQNDFNRRSRVKRRCAEFLISIMGWDRRWKRKYPSSWFWETCNQQEEPKYRPQRGGEVFILAWCQLLLCVRKMLSKMCQKMLPRKREFPSTGGGRDVQRVSNKMEMSQGLWRKSVNMLRLRWTWQSQYDAVILLCLPHCRLQTFFNL